MMENIQQELIQVGEQQKSPDHKLFIHRIHFTNNANMPPYFKNRLIMKSLNDSGESQSEMKAWHERSAKL